jgi:hypothetical protein
VAWLRERVAVVEADMVRTPKSSSEPIPAPPTLMPHQAPRTSAMWAHRAGFGAADRAQLVGDNRAMLGRLKPQVDYWTVTWSFAGGLRGT